MSIYIFVSIFGILGVLCLIRFYYYCHYLKYRTIHSINRNFALKLLNIKTSAEISYFSAEDKQRILEQWEQDGFIS